MPYPLLIHDIDNIIAQADANEDGALDLDGYRAETGFRPFDKDGSGSIERGELGKAVALLGDQLTDQELAMIMREVDADGDGRVSFEEFKMMMHGQL
ncbi:Calmodulin-like protein 3 [Rhizoctonia solani]|uniref:Calmodulin-like protein 3 n=1 Tax=Rhizoctonia solani TaxID=456999 RepID=A0A8H7M2H8_9AGAM|nr:Calmodulin-like protein 3 [Rhizoctonia solani]